MHACLCSCECLPLTKAQSPGSDTGIELGKAFGEDRWGGGGRMSDPLCQGCMAPVWSL